MLPESNPNDPFMIVQDYPSSNILNFIRFLNWHFSIEKNSQIKIFFKNCVIAKITRIVFHLQASDFTCMHMFSNENWFRAKSDFRFRNFDVQFRNFRVRKLIFSKWGFRSISKMVIFDPSRSFFPNDRFKNSYDLFDMTIFKLFRHDLYCIGYTV